MGLFQINLKRYVSLKTQHKTEKKILTFNLAVKIIVSNIVTDGRQYSHNIDITCNRNIFSNQQDLRNLST